MVDPQITTFIQSLRGGQALVVLAYLFIRRAMTVEELEKVTGLHNDTVRAALKGLESKGRLYKQNGEHGRQTWLPAGDTFWNLHELQNPRFSDSGATTTTTIGKSKSPEREVVVAVGQSPRFSDSDRPTNTVFESNLKACRKAGIGEPAASRLSAMPHVTPDFIGAHISSLGQDDRLGLAILRIQNDELPLTWEEEIKTFPKPPTPEK